MAKNRKEETKFFDCATCNERFMFKSKYYCVLRSRDCNNVSETALCENVEICNWYHKKLSFVKTS